MRYWISIVMRDTVLVISCSLKRLMTSFKIYIFYYNCSFSLFLYLQIYDTFIASSVFHILFCFKGWVHFSTIFFEAQMINIYYIRKSFVKFFNHHNIKFKQDVLPKATVIDFYNNMCVIIEIKSNRWNIRVVYIITSYLKMIHVKHFQKMIILTQASKKLPNPCVIFK